MMFQESALIQKKKMVKDADHDEKVPVSYRLYTVDSLYEKFLSESHLNYNILYFKKNIPFCVIKPDVWWLSKTNNINKQFLTLCITIKSFSKTFA